jgi:tRNA(Ile)-lysidine synthase
LDGPHADDLRIAALADGIADCPDWRGAGLSRASLMASPAVWQGATLIAAPVAGQQNGWTARIVADFHSSLVAH